MSWTASTPEPIDKQDTDTIVGMPQTAPDGVHDAWLEHLEAAKEAASILVSAIGRAGDKVTVTLSGHANPDHAPCAGWSDEFIQISVQARPDKAS